MADIDTSKMSKDELEEMMVFLGNEIKRVVWEYEHQLPQLQNNLREVAKEFGRRSPV